MPRAGRRGDPNCCFHRLCRVKWYGDGTGPGVRPVLAPSMVSEIMVLAERQPCLAPSTTALDRCIAHSNEYAQSYNTLVLQTCHDLMLMHEKELLHLHAQVEQLQQLLG